RVGERCLTVGREDVAEHARRSAPVAAPRQGLERRGVRSRDHVRLEDPRESLDRRAVEADALAERGLELRRRDRDRLERAEHVGEPESDEADVPLLYGAENELL